MADWPGSGEGSVGPAGPEGPQGPAGARGAEGPAGPKGDPGAAGAAGAAGAKGAEGPAGPEGPKGAAGAKGDKGDAGAQGAVGPEGPKGAKGDAGAQGPEGPAGAGAKPLEWLALPMTPGVAQNFGGEYGNAEYAADADFLHFRGLPEVPNAGGNQLVAVLPEAHRPAHRRVFDIGDANTAGWNHLLILKPNGEMILVGSQANAPYLPVLDGLILSL